jgi:hypothetical protein
MKPLGYQALIERFSLQVPPLEQIHVLSPKTGVARHYVGAGGERIEIPRNRYQGGDDITAELTFALKRERLNLTVLAAAFEKQEVLDAIAAWLNATPTSMYPRLAAHLAKWLQDASFTFTLPAGAPRIRVLDEEEYFTGPERSDPQFGVINNLLGTRAFCPVVRRTETLTRLLNLDLRAKVSQAIAQIEPEVLTRAVDYLYLSETRSTFSIEKEIPDNQRAAKFRQLLELAGTPGALTEEQLCHWQNQIISGYFAETSFRNRQNWLSRSGRLRNIADFIPPAADQVVPMMEGVAQVAQLGAGNIIDPAIAATCTAFGLVFVHPFMDGNGRLHRFLLHHVLRQAGYTPPGVVLPLSARMLKALDRYSSLLKSYSAPRTALLDYVLDEDSQTILIKSPQPLWLYASFDATPFCEFILSCIAQCVEEDLAQEVKYLEAYDRAKTRLESWLDLPQPQLNLLIRLIVQGHGELSERKRKRFESLGDEAVNRAQAIVADEYEDYLATFAKNAVDASL